MATQTKIKIDLSGLEDLVKQFGKDYYTKVGILGSDAATKHSAAVTKIKKGKKTRVTDHTLPAPMTNAEIGIIHELGSISANIPPRSWLRFPIEFKKRDFIRFLSSNAVKSLLDAGQIKKIFVVMGIEAEGIIQDAFRTRGFGQWAKLSQKTIDAKGSSAPLIDTGQLRRAVTSEVVSNGKKA